MRRPSRNRVPACRLCGGIRRAPVATRPMIAPTRFCSCRIRERPRYSCFTRSPPPGTRATGSGRAVSTPWAGTLALSICPTIIPASRLVACYGELAITPDLVRTGEGLRQGVTELRQLMGWLRGQGVNEFGLWATSYGGWIGALLLGVEPAFRFAVLQAPIVNIDHAIWKSGTARHLRGELVRCGISQSLVQRHAHLVYPTRVQPACGADRVILAAGIWDRIVLEEDVAALHRAWAGSTLLPWSRDTLGSGWRRTVFRRFRRNG